MNLTRNFAKEQANIAMRFIQLKSATPVLNKHIERRLLRYWNFIYKCPNTYKHAYIFIHYPYSRINLRPYNIEYIHRIQSKRLYQLYLGHQKRNICSQLSSQHISFYKCVKLNPFSKINWN